MFQDLNEKFESIVRKLRGHGKLSEKNIAETMRQVRRVLLEADVNYKVARQFIDDVQQRALGVEVLKSITPGQQVVKIISDELTRLMGERESPVRFSSTIPSIIMLVGLQGSGKTSLAGKLGHYFQKRGRNPLLVAVDVYRPAAIQQLQIVGRSAGLPTFSDSSQDPLVISRRAVTYAREKMYDTLIIDTAGRMHIDDQMMAELEQIKNALSPVEILFVADSMTGQDAVSTASLFLQRLDFDGVVLTKMDGDARGGAALSIRAVTGKPIKYLSVGEKIGQVEAFHPDRMASRILGLGDVVSLVEKAQDAIDAEKAADLEHKLRHQEFTLIDFMEQLQQVKKMGPIQDLLAMLPGLPTKALKSMKIDDHAFTKVEAIINSMTLEERRRPQIIDGSRRKRIARGSGSTVQDVNRLLNQYDTMRKMIKSMKRGGSRRSGLPLGWKN